VAVVVYDVSSEFQVLHLPLEQRSSEEIVCNSMHYVSNSTAGLQMNHVVALLVLCMGGNMFWADRSFDNLGCFVVSPLRHLVLLLFLP
jgi:hypothetical protein